MKDAYEKECDHYLTKDCFENVIELIVKERVNSLKGNIFKNFFNNEFITKDINLINEIKTLNIFFSLEIMRWASLNTWSIYPGKRCFSGLAGPGADVRTM